DWRTYKELQPHKKFALFIADAPWTPEERKYFEFHQLRRRLEDHVSELIGSGKLVASACVKPLTPQGRRETISPDTWKLLSLNFEDSSAEGHGSSLVDITVHADLLKKRA